MSQVNFYECHRWISLCHRSIFYQCHRPISVCHRSIFCQKSIFLSHTSTFMNVTNLFSYITEIDFLMNVTDWFSYVTYQFLYVTERFASECHKSILFWMSLTEFLYSNQDNSEFLDWKITWELTVDIFGNVWEVLAKYEEINHEIITYNSIDNFLKNRKNRLTNES